MKLLKSTKSGYTLLFAVMIAVLVLGVAIFITGTARKQLILSSSARDSMYSFYAADSAIECATLAYKTGTLATSSDAVITCGGNTYTIPYTTVSATTDDFTGSVWQTPDIFVVFQQNSCARLTIKRGVNTGGSMQTVIMSRGYNVSNSTGVTPTGGTGDCPKITSRTVERALRLLYID